MPADPVVFRTTANVIFGPGSLEALPDQVGFLGGRKAFIITDPGIAQAGILDRVEGLLGGAGVEFASYTEVEPEPPTTSIDKCAGAIRDAGADLLIGLGGGSAMDTSQIASCAVANDLKTDAMIGVEQVPGPGLPMISIATTAGTASEVTGNAVTVLADRSNKMAVVSPYIYPNVAIVDAELTYSVPPLSTAATGIDAFCHAAESYISVMATPHTQMYATQALDIILSNLPRVAVDGGDTEARNCMARGSLFAGYTLANAGTVMVHAMAHVLGARARIPHGIANALCLLPAMRFYVERAPEKIAALADPLLVADSVTGGPARAAAALDIMEGLIGGLSFDLDLKSYGVKREDLHNMAEVTAATKRLMQQSPVEATAYEVEQLFESIY
ncbi:MAG TPA: iron-containing alcohol dehydrogenase [Chloroflexota bacterium]|nr:iron-containing alcohol dehydrogenase [Chloroflexota bacterium]